MCRPGNNQRPKQSAVSPPAPAKTLRTGWYSDSLEYVSLYCNRQLGHIGCGWREIVTELGMSIGGIDSSRIESMMAQLKAAASRPTGAMPPAVGATAATPAAKVNFADALKASLDQVSEAQKQSSELGERFSMGDDKVSLSDVMISMQKASIGFQATVQVRNKLVSAYHEIMNMQV
jgi:flagellar hook-basal body complex protein FliE